jgi:hypothetical protein
MLQIILEGIGQRPRVVTYPSVRRDPYLRPVRAAIGAQRFSPDRILGQQIGGALHPDAANSIIERVQRLSVAAQIVRHDSEISDR